MPTTYYANISVVIPAFLGHWCFTHHFTSYFLPVLFLSPACTAQSFWISNAQCIEIWYILIYCSSMFLEKNYLLIIIPYVLMMCVCVCVCMSMPATAHVWGSEDKSMKLVIPLTFIPTCTGVQDWTKVLGLVCKPLYPLRNLSPIPVSNWNI